MKSQQSGREKIILLVTPFSRTPLLHTCNRKEKATRRGVALSRGSGGMHATNFNRKGTLLWGKEEIRLREAGALLLVTLSLRRDDPAQVSYEKLLQCLLQCQLKASCSVSCIVSCSAGYSVSCETSALLIVTLLLRCLQ